MKLIASCAMCICLAGHFGLQARANALPQEVRPALPHATLSGQATMRFWGFDIYQATLWVGPGFTDMAYEASAFALELSYLRDFKGSDIASRSIAEMRRQGSLGTDTVAQWEKQMGKIFPDVTKGDRILGLHKPQMGAEFWCNGRLLGEIRDPVFAKLFFGIWLAPQTSEPQLRQALLSRSTSMNPVGSPP